MIIHTEGIILSALKFRETSLIVKLFTPDFGVMTCMVKGVRATKAKRKAALFQPGMFLQFVMNYNTHKSFQYFKEYRLAYVYHSIPFDIKKFSVLQFIIELVNQCVNEHQEDELLYTYLKEALIRYDEQAFNPNFQLNFVLQIMRILGIYPENNYSKNTPYFNLHEGVFVELVEPKYTLGEIDSSIIALILKDATALRTGKKRLHALELLLNYLAFHLQNFKPIKSLDVLKVVLS